MSVRSVRGQVGESDLLDACSLVVTLALVLVVALDVAGTERLMLALVFATFVPGWALVTNWSTMVRRSRVAIPVAFSLALTGLAATVTTEPHLWDPVALFYVEATASAGSIAFHVQRRVHAIRASAASPTSGAQQAC